MAFSGTGRCWCRVVVVAAVCAVLSGIPAFGSAYGVRAQCLAGYYQNVTDGGTCVLCTGHVEDVVQRGAPFPPDGTLRPGSVAVSGSGDTIALGFPSVTVNGDDHRGIVRVYSWDGEAWVAKGGDIEGLRFGFFGTVVALSDDGNTVAASAPAALYGTISTSGAVYAFTWDGSSWLRKGPTFAPESSGQYHFGNAMGLSASGNVLVVAEFFPLKSGPVARAFVYVWFTNVGGWLQRAVLVGPSVTAFYSRKFSVVISSDGNVIAIGSPSATSSRSEGAIFVYEWVSRDLVYERVGDPVVGLVGEGFGSSVALSGDGLVLAVGTVRRSASGQWSGGVRVFGRDGQAWVPMGSVINGASMFGYAGRSVALSGDGQVLLVPSRGNDSNTGILTVYLWVSGVWVQRGGVIRGRFSGNVFGTGAALSRDGTVVAGVSGYAKIAGRYRRNVGSRAFDLTVVTEAVTDAVCRDVYNDDSAEYVASLGECNGDGSRDVCVVCAGVEYPIGPSRTCGVCPTGEYPIGPSRTCGVCPTGEYRHATTYACEACPADSAECQAIFGSSGWSLDSAGTCGGLASGCVSAE